MSYDTIKVFLIDRFTVSDFAPVTVQPLPYDLQKGGGDVQPFLARMDLDDLKGQKAYINDKESGIFVNIQTRKIKDKKLSDKIVRAKIDQYPYPSLPGCDFTVADGVREGDLVQSVATIQFSAPKVLKDENIKGLNTHELGQAVEKVLSVAGRWLDFDRIDLKVARVDVCPTLEVKRPPRAYLDVLRALSGAVRMYDRFFDDTVVYANSVWQVCHYDKTKELSEIHGIDIDQDLLRAEFRFLRAAKVANYLDKKKAVTVDEFLSQSDKYLEKVKINVAKFYPETLAVSVPDIIDERSLVSALTNYIETGEGSFNKFIKELGMSFLSETVGGDTLLNAAMLSGVPKATAYRQFSELRNQRLSTKIKRISGSEIYTEFKEGVAEWVIQND